MHSAPPAAAAPLPSRPELPAEINTSVSDVSSWSHSTALTATEISRCSSAGATNRYAYAHQMHWICQSSRAVSAQGHSSGIKRGTPAVRSVVCHRQGCWGGHASWQLLPCPSRCRGCPDAGPAMRALPVPGIPASGVTPADALAATCPALGPLCTPTLMCISTSVQISPHRSNKNRSTSTKGRVPCPGRPAHSDHMHEYDLPFEQFSYETRGHNGQADFPARSMLHRVCIQGEC